MGKDLSIIIPLYNEEQNISSLHKRIRQVMEEQGSSYEIIYVDDGSTDNTFAHLRRLTEHERDISIVELTRNFGQTAAIVAGVANSTGEIVICMDGDLQNDPRDIPRLLEKLREGYDIVSGWRRRRQDALLSRKLPSWLANKLISRVTDVTLHDHGCTLKAYRREILQQLHLYGEMHRLIPAYAALMGATIGEIEVEHHPRYSGKSKYGLSRTVKVLLDLLMLKFLGDYGTKPLYAFGLPGLYGLLLTGFLVLLLFGSLLFPSRIRVQRSLLLLLIFSSSGFAFSSITHGILADMVMRASYEAQAKPIYNVRRVISSPQTVDVRREAETVFDTPVVVAQ